MPDSKVMAVLSHAQIEEKEIEKPVMDRSFNPARVGTCLLATSFILASFPLFFTSGTRTLALCILACEGVGTGLLSGALLPCAVMTAALFLPAWQWPSQAMTAERCLLYEGAVMVPFILFARSLRTGHEPLVSAIARQVHGTLRPDVARYTTALTWFWAGFLALSVLAPALLWLAGPAGSWRWPASGGVLGLTIVLAGLEYGLRLIVIRDFEHVSPWASVRAFRNRPARPPTGSDPSPMA
ncbi:MAG: hypothetical protein ABF990_02555 [Acetobacter sp.]|uniref:hypothetical protein n=2 Tax=Acetobacter sp. TaxID=440 RepID=UPI0039ECDE53